MTPKKKGSVPVLPDGFADLVPADQRYYYHVWRKANGLLADYSFLRTDLAPAEQAEVFTRPVQSSDPDLGRRLIHTRYHGSTLALRADLRASLIRVYLQHGMHSEPHPVKLFTNGPVIMPGDGRGAEVHWQLGTATIGDESEAVDAELLFLGCRILEALNLGPFSVRINTVGDALSRPAYQRALRDFFRTHAKRISAKVAAEAKEQPSAALMLLAAEDAELAREAPQSVDFLTEESRLYFRRLLEFLDEGKVPYVIDHTLLTTDDYASHTLWEFALDPIAAANEMPSVPGLVVIRGGRMDRMAELLGGPKTSSSGWVFDLSGVVTHLKAKGIDLPEPGARPKVFLSQLGEAAKKRSLLLFEDIRKSGIEVRYSLSRDTIKGQLRMAAKLGVRFALIFGQKEALEGTVIVREMDTGVQETIPQEKIIDELKKRLRQK